MAPQEQEESASQQQQQEQPQALQQQQPREQQTWAAAYHSYSSWASSKAAEAWGSSRVQVRVCVVLVLIELPACLSPPMPVCPHRQQPADPPLCPSACLVCH